MSACYIMNIVVAQEARSTPGNTAKPEIAAGMASFNNSRLNGLKQYQILWDGEVA